MEVVNHAGKLGLRVYGFSAEYKDENYYKL